MPIESLIRVSEIPNSSLIFLSIDACVIIAIMTHASIDKKIRDELGISDTLIRLSIGIEDILDLKKSLDDALKNI